MNNEQNLLDIIHEVFESPFDPQPGALSRLREGKTFDDALAIKDVIKDYCLLRESRDLPVAIQNADGTWSLERET